MFPAPGESAIVVAVAFILAATIAVFKILTHAEEREGIDALESLTEFPIDATAGYLSLALGLLAAAGRFSQVSFFNISLILIFMAAQLWALRKLRFLLFKTKTPGIWMGIGGCLALNWMFLITSSATAYAVATASIANVH